MSVFAFKVVIKILFLCMTFNTFWSSFRLFSLSLQTMHCINYIYILSKKRNAYSISHGFIFKVNKKTYYVKSIKITNIYQQSLSHKF
jgi:hypothetical protein